ncbi:G-type lectin S-receptor-like serine/threonine-protein kinase, partial [Trifolium pratense]
RNYTKAECRGAKDGAAFYNMVSMRNIVWKDNPYFEDEHTSSEEECSSACLVDCNCWAALYKNGTCKKQGLPLRYVKGTQESDNSTTKLGKYSIPSSMGNYTKAECRGEKDGAAFYNMVSMSNIVWNDNPNFEDQHMSSEEECSSSCMDDCNCWAALYKTEPARNKDCL